MLLGGSWAIGPCSSWAREEQMLKGHRRRGTSVTWLLLLLHIILNGMQWNVASLGWNWVFCNAWLPLNSWNKSDKWSHSVNICCVPPSVWPAPAAYCFGELLLTSFFWLFGAASTGCQLPGYSSRLGTQAWSVLLLHPSRVIQASSADPPWDLSIDRMKGP